MNKAKLIPITVLVSIAATLASATAAQADVYSCTLTGGTTATPGFQAIIPDLATTGADSLLGDPLTDTDNGVSYPNAGWEDGNYGPGSLDALCAVVDPEGPGDDGSVDTGLYSADITSNGAYDNRICGGTGLLIDRGPGDPTTINLTPIAALGPGEDIVDANYSTVLVAGTAEVTVLSATNENGEQGTGAGVGVFQPIAGNCVTTNVTEFAVAAALTIGH